MKTNEQADRRLTAPMGDGTGEGGPPTRTGDDRLVVSVARFIIESYWPNVREAFFLFLSVLLAFVLASAWAAREAALRDLRSQIAVLSPLAEEVSNLVSSLKVQEQVTDTARMLARTGVNPPTPCSTEFRNKGQFIFDTHVWQAISTSERLVTIGQQRYMELRKLYGDVAVAPQNAKDFAPAVCREYLEDLEHKADRVHENLSHDIDTEMGQVRQLERLGSVKLWLGLAGAVVVLIGVIGLWPIVRHTAGHVRRKRQGHHGAAKPRTKDAATSTPGSP